VFFLALGKETSLPRAIYQTLGKAFFAECRGFAECFYLALGKAFFVERPKKRSAKPSALGKEADSGSGSSEILVNLVVNTHSMQVHVGDKYSIPILYLKLV
jgi:hypothetical protein